MVEGGVLTTVSTVVVVVALVVAIVVGALFVGGRIAPTTENTEPTEDERDGLRAGPAASPVEHDPAPRVEIQPAVHAVGGQPGGDAETREDPP